MKILPVLLLLAVTAVAQSPTGRHGRSRSDGKNVLPPQPVYLDAKQPVKVRTADLLSRMTFAEKVGQLLAPLGWNSYVKRGEDVVTTSALDDNLMGQNVGSLYGVLRADPWSKVSLSTGLRPYQQAEAVNAIQREAVTKTRLHVPLFLAEECTHGHMAIGATVFPVPLGQASTWDPALLNKMAHAVAVETRASGGNVCYGPILDVARELRWSRVEETFGEDPFLIASLGTSVVTGFQGESLNQTDSVVSTLKHFAGYGQPEGGHNSAPTNAGLHEMETTMLPAFHAGVKAGAKSVMASYNEIDGTPSSANHYLLTDLLRNQWGFDGFVVSDLGGVSQLVDVHRVAADKLAAAQLAIRSGLDSDLGGASFKTLRDLEQPSRETVLAVNQAVGRVLRVKFEEGLFENPYVSPDIAAREIGSEAHRQLARKVADESIILLRNDGNLLPLSRGVKSIAVVGPNADDPGNQLGDYTAPQLPGAIVTVLEGIKRAAAPGTSVRYAKGCSIRGASTKDFADALEVVNQSDVAVVVLGGSSTRKYAAAFDTTGAATVSSDSEMESGEGFDRSTLELAGVQTELLQKIVALGKPVVLVLIEGRPLAIPWAAVHVPAILQAWYPGEEGGDAVADVLFGGYNPAGRLPVSVPTSAGALPVYYSSITPKRKDYVEGPSAALYSFGFGLSYTNFAYSNLRISMHEQGSSPWVEAKVDIKNTGNADGDEVAELYLRHDVSSVTTPYRMLKGFARIHIPSGESITQTFRLSTEDLAVFGREHRWQVEAGRYHIYVGGSSDAISQQGEFEVARTLLLMGR